jgi:glycosyltransferase involved in cell wall biosynthesis
MAPFAEPYLRSSRRPAMKCHLDLDIIESKTRGRLAQLYRATGKGTEARVEALLARRFEVLEEEAFARFDRVYVCSEQDKAELQRRSRAEVSILPNAVHAPGPVPPRTEVRPFTFLFIGTLSYYPNEDALTYFCGDIAPLIRQAAPRPFRLNVVGRGGTDAIRRLSHIPEVRIVGEVADVAPVYREADAVIVPLRAGGGTRIKILEAFSHRRPVVSTSIGLEGIEARHAEHVLVADTAQTFAASCLELMTDRGSAGRMAERAFSLFTHAYSFQAVVRALDPCPTLVRTPQQPRNHV